MPTFFALLSSPEEDSCQVVEDVKENFDEHVIQVMYTSFAVGIFGLGIVMLIIVLMSKALMVPLEYMNDIINHFGTSSSTKNGEIINPTPGYCCFPITELDDVVKEFYQMISSFSRSFASTARSMKDRREEILNGFNMQKDFDDLYNGRKEIRFGYKVCGIGNGTADITRFIHFGSNINATKDKQSKAPNSVGRVDLNHTGGSTSHLFFGQYF